MLMTTTRRSTYTRKKGSEIKYFLLKNQTFIFCALPHVILSLCHTPTDQLVLSTVLNELPFQTDKIVKQSKELRDAIPPFKKEY